MTGPPPATRSKVSPQMLADDLVAGSAPVSLPPLGVRSDFDPLQGRIRDGEGREALSLYRSAERITVAPDAEQRRVAMVEDWWRSYSEGEDALMVAKRNSEVEHLNATARELVKSEGRLGSEEIEVGGAAFAAGDLLITRVNDRAAGIYNRERWWVAGGRRSEAEHRP
jgi:hypothetical protein